MIILSVLAFISLFILYLLLCLPLLGRLAFSGLALLAFEGPSHQCLISTGTEQLPIIYNLAMDQIVSIELEWKSFLLKER